MTEEPLNRVVHIFQDCFIYHSITCVIINQLHVTMFLLFATLQELIRIVVESVRLEPIRIYQFI